MSMWYRYSQERMGESLHVFDIDDTLFHTTANVLVKDKTTGELLKSLSNQDFNNYILGPNEYFDFSEFKDSQKFNQESRPIEPMLRKMRAIHQNVSKYPGSKVIINTARSDFDDKDPVLNTFQDWGIPMDQGIHLHRAGNIPGDDLPAQKKNVVLRQYLDNPENDFRRVHFYDDSKTNLKYFQQLQQEYPHIDFNAYHVTPEGKAIAWPPKEGK